MASLLKRFRNAVIDVFDANTEDDQRRRLAAGQPRYYQDQQRQQVRQVRPAQPRPQQPEFRVTPASVLREVPNATAKVGKGIVSGITSSYNRVGNAIGETIYSGISGNAEQKRFQEGQQVIQQTIDKANQKLKDPTIPPAEKSRWNSLKQTSTRDLDKLYGNRGRDLGQVIERTDPVKGTAGILDIGLDVVTAGSLNRAKAGLKTGQLASRPVARKAAETAAKGSVRRVVEPAVTSGVSGAFNAVAQNGKDTNALDLAGGTTLGALTGGALGGLSLLPKRVSARPVSQVATPNVRLRPNEAATLSDLQDVLTGNVRNPRTQAAIVQDARAIQARTGIDVTTGTPREIQDRINTALEQPQNRKRFFTPLNEGGYLQTPGKRTPLEKEDTAFADMQRGINAQAPSEAPSLSLPSISPVVRRRNIPLEMNKQSQVSLPQETTSPLLPQQLSGSEKGVLDNLITSQAKNTPTRIKVKGNMSDAQYLERFGKERAGKPVKVKPFIPEDYAFDRWTDRSKLGLGRETLERNLDRVAGTDAPRIKKFLVDQSRANETNRAKFLTNKRSEVNDFVVKKLGIKPGSKESSLVQKYGEGLIDDNQLVNEAGSKAQNIAEASKYFRQQYDALLDEWNSVRRSYGYDPVPKRDDYFRHFQEINDGIARVGMLKNLRDLPTEISGITDIFKPSKPFSNAELRRYGNDTKFDAVGGFDNYLDSVSRQIFHLDTVQRGRSLEKSIRKAAGNNPDVHLPNFVANLGEWTNLVSGKKAKIDRAAEEVVGRKVYGATNWLRSRLGANMIGANLSSAVTNFIPFTQSLSTTAKIPAAKGLLDTVAAPFSGKLNVIDGNESSFLTRRFVRDEIASRGVKKVANVASTPFKLVDEFTSRSIVAGKYYDYLEQGLDPKAAMKAADDYASKLITDRTIGQMPNLIETKTAGFLTQFQAEVNNQVSFLMRDIPQLAGGNKAKVVTMLTQFAVFSYLFNSAYEKVLGRRPQIDVIQAVLDVKNSASENDDDTAIENVKQGLGKASERISTGLPFVSIATGGRLPINAAFPDRKALLAGISNIGNTEGKPVASQLIKGVSGPAAYLLPPFGGGQVKKTAEGLYAYAKGESKTPSGRKRFDVAQTPANLIKSGLFGQYTTNEGKEYIKGLSDNTSGKSGKVSAGTKDLPNSDQVVKVDGKDIKIKDLNQKELRKAARTNVFAEEAYNKLELDKRRQSANEKLYPVDLDQGSINTLRDHDARTTKEQEEYLNNNKQAQYWIETARYKNDLAEGKISDGAERIKRERALERYRVGANFDKSARDLYTLNKTQLYNYLSSTPGGADTAKQILAYDDALVSAGLITKNKFRDKYGNEAIKPKTASTGGGKGRGGSKKIPFSTAGFKTAKIGRVKQPKGIKVKKPTAKKTALRKYTPTKSRKA